MFYQNIGLTFGNLLGRSVEALIVNSITSDIMTMVLSTDFSDNFKGFNASHSYKNSYIMESYVSYPAFGTDGMFSILWHDKL